MIQVRYRDGRYVASFTYYDGPIGLEEPKTASRWARSCDRAIGRLLHYEGHLIGLGPYVLQSSIDDDNNMMYFHCPAVENSFWAAECPNGTDHYSSNESFEALAYWFHEIMHKLGMGIDFGENTLDSWNPGEYSWKDVELGNYQHVSMESMRGESEFFLKPFRDKIRKEKSLLGLLEEED